MSADRDHTHRYLVTVGPENLPGEPDDTHLAVLSWEPRLEAWVHGQAICGRSVPQGELADGTAASCTNCLALQADYEVWLAPGYQPGGDAEQLRLAQAGASEREDLLTEARDALEQAGQNGAHGDDWPQVAPAIRALAADRDRLAGVLAELTKAGQHGAWTFCPQLVAHVSMAAFARKISEKVVAIAQRDEAAANYQRLAEQQALADGAWGSVWLHGDWSWLTKNMTTPEREHAADCVARWSAALAEHDNEPERGEPEGLRWWRD